MAEEYSNKQEKKKDNGKEMTFWEHLDALRGHLFRSLMAITAFTILAFVNRKILFDKIILAPKDANFPTNRMLCKLGDLLNTPQLCLGNLELNIINIQLSGQFLTHMYISLAAGVVLALPYIVWEIFRFIEPGLYEHERKYARGGVWITSLLFITGVLFSYFLIVPLTIQFLGGYQVSATVANQIALGSYIKTVVSVSFAVGLVFELPVLIYFLARTGIVTAAWMRKNRKIMLVLTLVLSAIITPPDVFSQIMVAIPLIILYEFSIRIAAKVEKKRVVSMD